MTDENLPPASFMLAIVKFLFYWLLTGDMTNKNFKFSDILFCITGRPKLLFTCLASQQNYNIAALLLNLKLSYIPFHSSFLTSRTCLSTISGSALIPSTNLFFIKRLRYAFSSAVQSYDFVDSAFYSTHMSSSSCEGDKCCLAYVIVLCARVYRSLVSNSVSSVRHPGLSIHEASTARHAARRWNGRASCRTCV